MRPRRAGRFSCGDLPWRVLGLGCTLVHRPGQADRLGLSERVAEPSKLLAAQEALALALWIALDTLRGVVGESHFIPLRESSVRAPSAMTVFPSWRSPIARKERFSRAGSPFASPYPARLGARSLGSPPHGPCFRA